jgi:hypothetical protein
MGVAVRKRARHIDDDEDDDVPARVGRPRAPEEFGPPRPEPHEREEFVTACRPSWTPLRFPSSAETSAYICNASSAARIGCMTSIPSVLEPAGKIR